MGVSYYVNIVIGVRVTRADFLVPQETLRQCKHGHKHATQKFCDKDGTPFAVRTVERATPAFKKTLDKDDDPVEAFDEWLFDGDGPLFHVDRVTSGERREGATIALGKMLQRIGDHQWGGAQNTPATMSLAEIEAEFEAARRVAASYGITDRPVEMFVSLYVSC